MTDTAAAADRPQIYLSTPPQVELAGFREALAAALDAAPVACLRLALAGRDEDRLARTADLARDVAHARDVPVVIDEHVRLAERLGLDGVHLTGGARRVREARRALGRDAIVGAGCGASRHQGLAAGEQGADYVAFGPVGGGQLLAGEDAADAALFAWWAEMIEVPVVAEGGIGEAEIAWLAPHADFICLGEEVWGAAEGAADALRRHARLIAAG